MLSLGEFAYWEYPICIEISMFIFLMRLNVREYNGLRVGDIDGNFRKYTMNSHFISVCCFVIYKVSLCVCYMQYSWFVYKILAV